MEGLLSVAASNSDMEGNCKEVKRLCGQVMRVLSSWGIWNLIQFAVRCIVGLVGWLVRRERQSSGCPRIGSFNDGKKRVLEKLGVAG